MCIYLLIYFICLLLIFRKLSKTFCVNIAQYELYTRRLIKLILNTHVKVKHASQDAVSQHCLRLFCLTFQVVKLGFHLILTRVKQVALQKKKEKKKKWSFLLRISSVNVTKSTRNCGYTDLVTFTEEILNENVFFCGVWVKSRYYLNSNGNDSELLTWKY